MRNLAAKVPEDLWPEFKARAAAAYRRTNELWGSMPSYDFRFVSMAYVAKLHQGELRGLT